MELGAKRKKTHYSPHRQPVAVRVPVSERPAIGKTTGKDAQRQYNTARLNEYPSQLCRGFALSFHDAAMSRVASDPEIRELDGGLLAEYASMVLSAEQVLTLLTLRDDRLTRGRRLNSLHTLRPTGLIAQGKERKVIHHPPSGDCRQ